MYPVPVHLVVLIGICCGELLGSNPNVPAHIVTGEATSITLQKVSCRALPATTFTPARPGVWNVDRCEQGADEGKLSFGPPFRDGSV